MFTLRDFVFRLRPTPKPFRIASTSAIKNVFLLHHILIFSTRAIVARELLMVGPREREWKVLRETNGERFVGLKKGHCF